MFEQLTGQNAGKTTVCIWGEPGAGKSTVACFAARILGFTPVAVLHAGDPDLLRDEITDLLIAEGMEPTNWSDSYCRSMLRQRFSRQPEVRPIHRILIIDNVDDESLIPQLVPERARVAIFITMRTKPRNPNLASVELEDFTESEAYYFIASSLSGSNDTEVLALARLLGCRPLALDHAVRFLKESDDVALRELINALTGSISDGLAVIADPVEKRKNLIVLYKLILGSVLSDSMAQPVIDNFLAIAGKGGVIGFEALYEFTASQYGGQCDRPHFRAGFRALLPKGLLRESYRTLPGRSASKVRDRYLMMHPLTYEILRDLRGMTPFEVEMEYLRYLSSPEVAEAIERSVAGTQRLTYGLVQAHIIHLESTVLDRPGWEHFHCIDEDTWIGVRTDKASPSEDGETYTARYEVYPHGVMKLDYRTGTRAKLEQEEALDFYNTVMEYRDRVGPLLERFMSLASDDDSASDT